MIGLGSNRLSVCRRGGMSVTQAGRGGMEWLGVRVPLWSSPYSAQATAALKAQFSLEQWATIRDYGFAHPEIVPIVNTYGVEDPKIMYSIISELGKERYCYGDGNIAITTSYVPKYNTIYKWKFSRDVAMTTWDGVQGSSSAFEAADQFSTHIESNNLTAWIVKARNNCGAITAGVVYEIEFGRSYLKKKNLSTGVVNNYSFYNSAAHAGTGTLKYGQCLGCPGKIKGRLYPHMAYTDGVLESWLIPCRHDGVNGFIDVISGEWCTLNGSGSFTISETQAS